MGGIHTNRGEGVDCNSKSYILKEVENYLYSIYIRYNYVENYLYGLNIPQQMFSIIFVSVIKNHFKVLD